MRDFWQVEGGRGGVEMRFKFCICFFFLKANNFLIQCSKLLLLRLEPLPSPCPTFLNVDALTN